MASENGKQVYVVIGSTGGVGSALCKRLAERNATLVLAARGEERLNQQAESVGAAEAVALDATDFESVGNLFKKAGEIGQIVGAANLPGSIMLKPAHLVSREDWDETIALNLTTAMATVRAAAQAMRGKGGSIALMAAAVGRHGLPNHEAIAAAKAGVIGLAASAAASYAPSGVRVNCVAPGLIKTPLTERIWKNEKSLAASEGMHALGRAGEPEDVAAMLDFLLDPANTWITGQVFGVDGGLARVMPQPRRTA